MKQHLLKIPLVGSFLKTAEADVGLLGIQRAMRKALQHSHTRLTVNTSELAEYVLRHEPVVVVANHPNTIDPVVLLAASPERFDAFLIIDAYLHNVSKIIKKHLIPVYINCKVARHGTKRDRLVRLLNFEPMLSEEEEKKRNIDSIKNASEKVSKGGMVIIFPGDDKPQWYNGVGFLLKDVKVNRKLYIVQAYIQGTTYLDFFRVFPLVGKIFPTLKVTFSEPYLANDLLSLHPKEITTSLESRYRQWVRSHCEKPLTIHDLNPDF
jgi:hypothetical protein